MPQPPDDPEDLLAWADTYGVSARLDDVIVGGSGPMGTSLPGREGEALTYRQILLGSSSDGLGGAFRRRRHDADETARVYLHRLAVLGRAHREARAWLDEHGREPEDEALAAFLARLRRELKEVTSLAGAPGLSPGTYERVRVDVAQAPAPRLLYEERTLTGPRGPDADDVSLSLIGWNEGPLRWGRYRGARAVIGVGVGVGDVSPAHQRRALEAMIDFVRDPRAARAQEALGELLRLPAWQYALGTLDASLSRLEADAPGAATATEERVAFRVIVLADGALDVEPVLQKRTRGAGFSRGARLQWFQLPERKDLSAADRRAYQAYDDRFARRSNAWGGPLAPAQVFGILRALIDHPAVFLTSARDQAPAGERAEERDGRLDLRQGRLRLRFSSAVDGGLSPQFDLLGVTLLASEVDQGLHEGGHLIHLHRFAGAPPQVLLAQVTPQAVAVVRALALAPATFPPEAHDALAARLEALQETVDMELPSTWTRTISPSDGRLIVRLELLASGAVQARLGVRPVKLGPVFAPGEGAALVLEGRGRERHGARRDLNGEREAGHALAAALSLTSGDEEGPWCWRIGGGDPALHLVAELAALGEGVLVEWADDEALVALGSVGLRSMRMRVADRRDWFAVDGAAEVTVKPRGKSKLRGNSVGLVPLAALLAAIREGRRYVPVGARGFVRIEEALRAALARADSVMFERDGVLGVSSVASDPLVGLVEDEEQLEASLAFRELRRRMRDSESQDLHVPAKLSSALRPYQREGAAWLARLAHWGAGAIVAVVMGLGKTVQTLAVLCHRAALGPSLVVAPTSVVSSWIDEAARFAPELAVRLYRGEGRAAALRALGPGDLVVTSYAIAALDGEALGGLTFGSLVLDEAQAVKNATTERAKALRALDAKWRLALTGTPIENHLGEIWSVLRVISPGLLGSWEQFRARFAVPIEKFGDDGRRRALAALLRPFVLRRTKAEVARELPARTELVRVVSLSPEEHGLYEQLRKATVDELALAKKDKDRDAGDMRFVLLAALTRLRQLCCHPRLVYPRTDAGSSKAAYLLELLGELREGDHKALVFSQFRSFLDLLAPRLRQHGFRVLVLDGTTPVETREQRIAAFQRGEADAFLISLKAGGFGLNLTAADTVIHLDPWWNPAVEDQATARAHRIGQTKPVTAVRLVARGTIEEAVLSLHAGKRALAAGVLEGTDVAASLATEDLLDLIRSHGST
ncbi:MAG: Superfamily helicase, family [Myxococcales bacterium]|nr:Superfamily helicase, family [Myxococcales bacterium]